MRIMHNMDSLDAYREYSRVLDRQGSGIGKISSGYKICTAKDNCSALAQSERIHMQIRGLNIGKQNSQDGVSMLQTAEGGLEGMLNVLQRARQLVVKYENGVNSTEDRKVIKSEITQLIKGYDDICKNAQFNNKSLFGEDKVVEMPVSSNVGDVIKVKLYKLDSSNIKFGALSLDKINDLETATGGKVKAHDAIEFLDAAIDKLVSIRSNYGALENRFGGTMERNLELRDKMQGAESEIRDADVAEEILNLSKENILMQACQAIMAQSNNFPMEVLRVLENAKR